MPRPPQPTGTVRTWTLNSFASCGGVEGKLARGPGDLGSRAAGPLTSWATPEYPSLPEPSIMGDTGSAPTSQAGFKGSTRSNADTARRSPHAASRRVGCLSRVPLPGCAKSRAPGVPSTASHQGPGAQCLLSERTASGRTRECGRRATGHCQPSTLPSPRCLWFSSRWLGLLHPSLCVPPQRPEVRKL